MKSITLGNVYHINNPYPQYVHHQCLTWHPFLENFKHFHLAL
ncbi:MAG: hypothetical protein K0Q79_1242 [Flavipsychrobacter sp.]|jgi:hypothetical protein|nr:hypothetical protein [Flavipsychrobacter sp.]